MDEAEDRRESIIDRAALFSINGASSVPARLNPFSSLEEFFDVKNAAPETTTEVDEASSSNTFNLFSTTNDLSKVSLNEPTYQVPLVNRKRPREYYFTSPDDNERLSKLASSVISGSQILEMSKQPWAAKQNPRLVIRIPSKQMEKVKQRRRPSKKERDYKKKVKLEEEKTAREERRYGKFLKFGQGNRGGGGRGNSRGRGRGSRGVSRGRGNVKS